MYQITYGFTVGGADYEVDCDVDFDIDPADPIVGIFQPTVCINSIEIEVLNPSGDVIKLSDRSWFKELEEYAWDRLYDDPDFIESCLDTYWYHGD